MATFSSTTTSVTFTSADGKTLTLDGFADGDFTFEPPDRPVARSKRGSLSDSLNVEFSIDVKTFYLHPSWRPLPWRSRNPSIQELRWWWVWHLKKSNRSFKRTRIAAIRRMWREQPHFRWTLKY